MRAAAWANGLALAVLVYATANVSGGHLNPAVTVATLATGHTSASRAVFYVGAQLLGSALASLAHKGLVPLKAGGSVGCFGPGSGASLGQAFGWELLATLMLVLVIYSVAVGEPSFGVAAPAAIGLTLSAAALTMGPFSGAALNPARALGPALVFGCGPWRVPAAYIAAELLGALAAATASWPLYGTGLQFGRWWDAAGDAAAAARGAITDGYERLADAVHHRGGGGGAEGAA